MRQRTLFERGVGQRRALHHRHFGAVLQFELAGGHHQRSGVQALAYHHAVADSRARFHQRPFDLQRAALGLAHHIHRIAVNGIIHRDFRHGQHLRLGPQHQAGVGEHAGRQQMLRIVGGRLQTDRTRVHADLRFNGDDFGGESAARMRVDHEIHHLALGQQRAVLLGHGQVHEQRVEIGQRHDFVAGPEVLAEMHAAYAEHAIKGRAHQFLRDSRFRGGDLGFDFLEAGFLGIQLALGNREFDQPLGAIEVDAGQFGLGLQTAQFAALGRIIELHQRLAGAHLAARLEMQGGDAAVHFRRDGHLTHRLQRADAGQQTRHILQFGGGRRHRHRRRPVTGERGRGLRLAEIVKPKQAAEQNDQRHNHQCQTFLHA